MFYSQEQWDEAQEEEYTQAMIHDYGGFIPAAHAQWHQIHGPYAVCPLDCGAMSPEQAEAEAAYEAEAYEEWLAAGSPAF